MRSRTDTLVISATHDRYVQWCIDNGRTPGDGVRFISHPDQLRGWQCVTTIWESTPYSWGMDAVNEALWLIDLGKRCDD